MTGVHVQWSGRGPPLVLLHGWAMHGGFFDTLIPALSAQHRVAVVDLPGHGHSTALPVTSLDAMVEAVASPFVDEKAPLRILGWSLGAAVALRWARLAPSGIDKLVLVGATPRFTSAPDWTAAMEATTLARFGDELTAAYRLTLQRFLTLQVQGSDSGRATLQSLRSALFVRGEPCAANLRAALALLQSMDLRDDAAQVPARSLVVSGGRDALTPAAAGEWLAATMPAARGITIAGAAHAAFLSHRAEFDAAVLPFLDEA